MQIKVQYKFAINNFLSPPLKDDCNYTKMVWDFKHYISWNLTATLCKVLKEDPSGSEKGIS